MLHEKYLESDFLITLSAFLKHSTKNKRIEVIKLTTASKLLRLKIPKQTSFLHQKTGISSL